MGVLLYLGSYGSGIGVFERRGETLAQIGTVETPDPSYLTALHPTAGGGVLYAANELTDGAVSSFRIGPDGSLTPLGAVPTGGAEPCHLLVHPAGYLLVSNYGSGSVAVHPIGPDGRAGDRCDLAVHPARPAGEPPAHPDRQDAPHAHETALDPASGVVVAIDLGLDELIGYRLDPDTGRLTRTAEPFARVPAGTGPRHAAVHPSGRWYVADELSSTVSVLAAGRPIARHPATVADESSENLPSEIALGPDGRHLYLANRGRNTIATFAVEPDGGLRRVAEVPTGGDWPRHFAIVDDLMYVANERSGSIVTLRIDPATGVPAPTGAAVRFDRPTCVLPVRLG